MYYPSGRLRLSESAVALDSSVNVVPDVGTGHNVYTNQIDIAPSGNYQTVDREVIKFASDDMEVFQSIDLTLKRILASQVLLYGNLDEILMLAGEL